MSHSLILALVEMHREKENAQFANQNGQFLSDRARKEHPSICRSTWGIFYEVMAPERIFGNGCA